MACLAHDKRFRSSFHSVINELRNEKRLPVSILRTMPMKCCTCHTDSEQILAPLVVQEDNPLTKMHELVQRVNRENQFNPKLILSLHQFRHIIEENQAPQTAQESDKVNSSHDDLPKRQFSTASMDGTSSHDSSSSSDSEEFTPMEITPSKTRYGRKPIRKTLKPSKPIRNGTFLFLPYVFKGTTTAGKASDPLLEVARTLQRQRFINRNGHFSSLEKQYHVRINMITAKTSEQVTAALENAKNGLENLTIHGSKNPEDSSKKQDGEWVLVRSKKPQSQTDPANIEKLLDDLTNRWETCMHIKKRTWSNSNDSSEDDSISRKK